MSLGRGSQAGAHVDAARLQSEMEGKQPGHRSDSKKFLGIKGDCAEFAARVR